MKYLLFLFCLIGVNGAYAADIPLSYSDDEPPLPFYDAPYIEPDVKQPRELRRRAIPDAVLHAELSRDVRDRAEHLAARIFGDDVRTPETFAVPERPPGPIAAKTAAPTAVPVQKQAENPVVQAVQAISQESGVALPARADGSGRGSYIDSAALESFIREELDQKIDGEYLLSVSGLSSKRGYFVRLTDSHIVAEHEYVAVNEDRGRFEAAIILRSGGTFERVVFRGRAEPAVAVPAPADAIPAGTIITADMLTDMIVSQQAAGNMLREQEDVIGKSAARLLRTGRALRARDVRAPVLVKRNAVIDVEYSAPGVFLRATAQASEDGAKGDVIRARNITGDKVIYAQVTGYNEAKAVEQQ